MADRRTVQEILRTLGVLHASPREALATKLATVVETGVNPLKGGDRDSTGVLQQRPSQGWGPVGESVSTDVAQFVRAAKKLTAQGFKGTAGQLAQAVQRSAFPAKYDQARGQAAQIFGDAPAGGGGSSTPGTPGSLGSPFGGALPQLQQILSQGAQRPVARVASAPQAPAFAARAVLPEGYQPVPTVSASPDAAQGPSAGDLAQQVIDTADTSPVVPATAGTPAVSSGAGAEGSSGARGEVLIAPGANRQGVGLTPGITKLLAELAGATGKPVRVGTGTAHSKMTTSGNVSDHWDGNGADLPATGQALTDQTAAALSTYGAGKTVQWQRNDGKTVNVKVTAENAAQLAQQGGLFNIPYGTKRRIQVIGNSHIGGDHTNHTHVGVTAR